MSDYLERFIADYISDSNALRRASKPPSAKTPPSFVTRPPWDRSTRTLNTADSDMLRTLLRRTLIRKGFDKDYASATQIFEANVAAEAHLAFNEVQRENEMRERSVVWHNLKIRLAEMESDELYNRRGIHKRSLRERNQIRIHMLFERVELVSQIEYQLRLKLVKRFLVELESIRMAEKSQRESILSRSVRRNSSPNSAEKITHNRHVPISVQSSDDEMRVWEQSNRLTPHKYPKVGASAELTQDYRTQLTPERHPLTSDTETGLLSPLTPSNQLVTQQTTADSRDTDSVETDLSDLLMLVQKSKSFFIGISLVEIASGKELSKAIGLTVDQVHRGGPGEDAGIKIGDIVVAVAGIRVSNFDEFRGALYEHARVGQKIPFILVRSRDLGDCVEDEVEASGYDLLELYVTVLTTERRFAPLGNSVFFEIDDHHRQIETAE